MRQNKIVEAWLVLVVPFERHHNMKYGWQILTPLLMDPAGTVNPVSDRLSAHLSEYYGLL